MLGSTISVLKAVVSGDCSAVNRLCVVASSVSDDKITTSESAESSCGGGIPGGLSAGESIVGSVNCSAGNEFCMLGSTESVDSIITLEPVEVSFDG